MKSVVLVLLFMMLCLTIGVASLEESEILSTTGSDTDSGQVLIKGSVYSGKYINDSGTTTVTLPNGYYCKKCYQVRNLDSMDAPSQEGTPSDAHLVIDGIRQEIRASNLPPVFERRLLSTLDRVDRMIALNKSGQASTGIRMFIRILEKTRGNNLTDEQVDSIIQEIRSIDFSRRSWKP